MASEFKKHSVIIVGAGPVGLLTALRLGRADISTLVLESHPSLLRTTRACVYMPVINPVLRKLGIYSTVAAQGFLNHQGVIWRNIRGEALAQMRLGGESDNEEKGKGGGEVEYDGVLLLGQAEMNDIILAELEKCPSVEIKFGMGCVGIENLPGAETIKVMAHDRRTGEDLIFGASYLLGTDGANSTVRRISCIPFEGFTWQEWKMIGTDVLYDFPKEQGFTPMNFCVDPEDWAVIVYTGQDSESGDPLWRVAYGEDPNLPGSKEEIMERAHERVARYTKGVKDFKIIRAEPYSMHQRCAAQARKGRVLLAGDALHSNNPIGGLGLTGGILDAFSYGNALTRVLADNEPDSLLTECATSRRDAWLKATNPTSTINLKRITSDKEEDVKAREEFFAKLNTDPGFAKRVRDGMNLMMLESFEKEGGGKGERRDSGVDVLTEKMGAVVVK